MLQHGNGLSTGVILITAILALTGITNAQLADFDDLTLAVDSYWNGADGSGGFTSGTASFNNNYDTIYGSWDGFAYSNRTDTSLYEWSSAQFNAITGTGQANSANYGVGFVGWNGLPTITLNSTSTVNGMYITNNNYAYYSMLNGDGWAKKFGGTGGNDPDWFLLTITGKNQAGTPTGTIDFYLADFRFTDNQLDYIVNTWLYVDLSPLGQVKTLEFSLASSDVGSYGMNTPAYFAIDSIVPEPVTITMLGLGSLLIIRKRSLS